MKFYDRLTIPISCFLIIGLLLCSGCKRLYTSYGGDKGQDMKGAPEYTVKLDPNNPPKK